MEYDVFISCKSEDYPFAEKVYSYLVENNLNVFFASKELRKLGDSEYRDVIEHALENSTHLIVLASKPEYLQSKWVKYEWGLFVDGKLDGSKTGNLITILKDVSTKDIYFALRKYQSLDYDNYKEEILGYVNGTAPFSTPITPITPIKKDFWGKMKSIFSWWKICAIFIACFLGFYTICFSIGYFVNREYTSSLVEKQTELLKYVNLGGAIMTYDHLGIVATYDAESRQIRDIRIDQSKYELTGTDFWKAASLSSGFTLWTSYYKHLKVKGEAGVFVFLGSFFGTLFGYSTGRYVALRNNEANYQKEMIEYLKNTDHWATCQESYELQQLKRQESIRTLLNKSK